MVLRRTDRHGTEWAVSALPLGGYVKMQDDPPPGASPSEIASAFNTQPVGKRIAIVAAGPIFNLILAVLLYAALNLAGTQEPAAILAKPAVDAPAARAGLLEGDRILSIGGEEVVSWADARWRLMDVMSGGGRALVEVSTPSGAVHQRELTLPANAMDPAGGDPLAAAGLRLAQPRPAVRSVIAGGQGEAAGLKDGDLIVAVDGQPAPDTGALVRRIQESAGQPLALTLKRGSDTVTLNVTPRAETVEGRQIGRLGVQLGGDVPMVTVRYGVFESLWRGAVRTWDTAWFSLRMMGRMVMGEVSWRNVSGGHDRRLRWPDRPDRHCCLYRLYRVDQYQPWRTKFAAHSYAGRRPSAVLSRRNRAGQPAARPLDRYRTARRHRNIGRAHGPCAV